MSTPGAKSKAPVGIVGYARSVALGERTMEQVPANIRRKVEGVRATLGDSLTGVRAPSRIMGLREPVRRVHTA